MWIGNYDTKFLVDSDNIFMTYNNVIQIVDMYILDLLLSNYNKGANKEFNLDYIRENSEDRLLYLLLNRKKYNIFDWLKRDDKIYNDSEYKMFIDKFPVNDDIKFCTDFILGFRNYIYTMSSVKKLTIATGDNNYKKQICKKLFDGFSGLSFCDNDDETIENHIKDKTYQVIITDRSDLITKNLDTLLGKIICIPYIGYLFEFVEIEKDIEPILVSKDRLEILTEQKEITIGYFNPINIKDTMFGKG